MTFTLTSPITWARTGGYEVTTKGDSRFSALVAKMPDGRTIEEWYQCDIKGYDPGGTNWKLGKGKPPLLPFPHHILWEQYLSLWRLWTIRNIPLMKELLKLAQQNNDRLSDRFAKNDPDSINQARALATILSEWFI